MNGTNPPALPSTSWAALPPPRENHGSSLGIFNWLLVLAMIGGGVASAYGNWTYFMGGRFTPLRIWTGYGKIHSSAGSDYGIYLHLTPREFADAATAFGAKPNLNGVATVCTPQGTRLDYNLQGRLVNAWLNTEGKQTALTLVSLGKKKSGSTVDFRGVWHDGSLVLNDKGSLVRWLKRAGLPSRRAGRRLPDKAERAQVTVSYGSRSEFDRFCGNVITRPDTRIE